MERWGQTWDVQSDAFSATEGTTSRVFGRVAKELKAVELVWGEKIFPPGSLETKGGSAGYPTKVCFGNLLPKQLGELGGEQAGEDKNPFIRLLQYAGRKAQLPVADDQVKDKMGRAASALSLLTAARLLRLRSLNQTVLRNQGMSDARRPPEECEGGPRKRQQHVPGKRKVEHDKHLDLQRNELAAVEALIRSLLVAVRRTQEGRDDELRVSVGDNFRLCELCMMEDGDDCMQKAATMVRSFCGHVMCLECFGNWMLAGPNNALQTCPFGRCKDFQAVEVGAHIAFLGSAPQKMLPPITGVGLEEGEREGFVGGANAQERLREWNQSLFRARRRALPALFGGQPQAHGAVLAEVEEEMIGIQQQAQEQFGPRPRSLVLEAIAQSHVSWVRWIREDRVGAIEVLQEATENLRQASTAPASGETVKRFLGSTLCTLGLRYLRQGIDLLPADAMPGGAHGAPFDEARRCFDQSVEECGSVEGEGDAHGHIGIMIYTKGAAQLTGVDVSLRGACHAYERQLECYGHAGRIPKFIEDAIRLNIGLLLARRGEIEQARNVLRLEHEDGNVFQPLASLLDGALTPPAQLVGPTPVHVDLEHEHEVGVDFFLNAIDQIMHEVREVGALVQEHLGQDLVDMDALEQVMIQAQEAGALVQEIPGEGEASGEDEHQDEATSDSE